MSAILPSSVARSVTSLPHDSVTPAAAAGYAEVANYMREGDSMSEIAEIMALFGHIDEIVGEHPDDPSVVETVERMLPGTTGDQQGWYSQIQRLFREISGSESSGLPEYDA